jgi:hypothetical protein
MALADPQSITIGSALSLARILTGEQDATYADDTGMFSLRVSHQLTRTRKRSLISVTRKAVVTDPITDLKREVTASANTVFDRPIAGFTEAELLELISGSNAWGSAGTNANYKKVLAWQS